MYVRKCHNTARCVGELVDVVNGMSARQPRGPASLSGAAGAFAQAQAAAAAQARAAQFRRERERPYGFERRDARAPLAAHMDARALHLPHNAPSPLPGQPDYTQVRPAPFVVRFSCNLFYFVPCFFCSFFFVELRSARAINDVVGLGVTGETSVAAALVTGAAGDSGCAHHRRPGQRRDRAHAGDFQPEHHQRHRQLAQRAALRP